MAEAAVIKDEESGELTGVQKAAILLLLVGEDAAGAVFRKLSQVEVREITAHMASLRSVRNEMVDAVAQEFVEEAKRNSAITTEGREYLEKVFREAFGKDDGPHILKQVTSLSSSNAIETLKTLDPFTISNFIRQEHPQTIAFLLCNLPPDTAGEIIKTLRTDFQADVIRRMARIKLMVPDIMDDLGEVLRNQVKSMGTLQTEEIGGVKAAANVVNFLDRATEDKVFEELQTEDPGLADEIRAFTFTFEDLKGIDGRGIQRLLREISTDELTLALKTASDDLQDLFFKNMSERAAEMVREDLEIMGPVKLSEVEGAQQSIIGAARRLEEAGELAIGGKGGGDEYV